MPTITTKQELVNAFAAHLRKQGEPASTYGGQCEYRTDSGLSCGFGGLIKANHYNKNIEGFAVSDSSVFEALVNSGVQIHTITGLPYEDFATGLVNEARKLKIKGERLDADDFLGELQACHDDAADEYIHDDDTPFLESLDKRLEKFCKKYHLQYPAPQEQPS